MVRYYASVRTAGVVLPLVAALLATPYAHAQTRPDFSGTWRLDPEYIANGPELWEVMQTADTITLFEPSRRDVVWVYRLDGKPTERFDTVTGRWVYRTLWIGTRLVITSEGEIAENTSTETWHLDDRGRLVIEWQRNPRAARLLPLITNRYSKIK